MTLLQRIQALVARLRHGTSVVPLYHELPGDDDEVACSLLNYVYSPGDIHLIGKAIELKEPLTQSEQVDATRIVRETVPHMKLSPVDTQRVLSVMHDYIYDDLKIPGRRRH